MCIEKRVTILMDLYFNIVLGLTHYKRSSESISRGTVGSILVSNTLSHYIECWDYQGPITKELDLCWNKRLVEWHISTDTNILIPAVGLYKKRSN